MIKGLTIQVNTAEQCLPERVVNVSPGTTISDLAVIVNEELKKANEWHGRPTSVTIVAVFV